MYKKRRLAVMIGMLAGSTSVFAQTDMTRIEARPGGAGAAFAGGGNSRAGC